MHSKAHCKEENSKLISKLKAGMNDNRKYFN